MIGLLVEDGVVVNTAIFDDGVADGWIVAPPSVCIGWAANMNGSFSRPSAPIEKQRAEAVNLVKALAKQHIEAGYQSDALGTTHTYPSNLEYQTNIIGAKDAGVALTFLCADENQVWTRRQHSAAELAQVFADGVLRKSTLLDAMDAIVADINGAADQAALDAIDITTGWPE